MCFLINRLTEEVDVASLTSNNITIGYPKDGTWIHLTLLEPGFFTFEKTAW